MTLTASFKIRYTRVLTHQKRLVMRLMAILLIASLQLPARTVSQTVSLSVKGTTLKKVMASIEAQTGYVFFYDGSVLKNAKPVTANITNMALDKALHDVFENQPVGFSIKEKTINLFRKDPGVHAKEESPVSPVFTALPPPTVHGRITNEKGEAVAGVSIAIKGGKVVGVTDNNGEFTLNNLADNATLVFTAVNMETLEVRLNGRTELALKSRAKVNQLADVEITANTGYQVVRPNEITGALTVVSNRLLNQQKGTSILNRLDGVVPGLSFTIGKINTNPSNNTGITIRGLSTINGPLDPLIVLDNLIYEGSLSNINPDDIENITVLKDAAATSIWGARAGNGVIVLTRKKGRFNQPMQVEYSDNFSVVSKPDLYSVSRISSADFISAEQFLYNQGYYASSISVNPFTRTSFTPAVEIFIARTNGQISASDSATRIDALKGVDIRDQYNKYFYRTAFTQQHSLNVRGGSGAAAYLFGVGYINGRDNLDAPNEQFNAHLENAFKLGPKLTVALSNYFTLNNQQSGRPAYDNITIGNVRVPYLSFADASGNPLPVDIGLRGGFTDTAGGGKLLNWKYYPLTDYSHAVAKNRLSELVSDLSVQYQILSWLKATARLQYQRQQSDSRTLYDLDSYNARNQINTFSSYGANGNLVYAIPMGGILNMNTSTIETQSGRGQLDADRTWGQHHLTAIAGAEVRKIHAFGNGSTLYGYNENPLTSANVDLVNQYPTYFGGSSSIGSGPTLSDVHNNYVSIYANGSYTFRQRYSLYGSVRRDGSNLFGANTNDRWKPLWSIGGAWDISRESFYRFAPIPYLKFRLTYGVSGNVDPRRTALPVARYSTANPLSNLPFARISTLNDPNLRWEQSAMLNLGLDFATKDRRILGSLDFYYKKGTDLYGTVLYDYSAWGSNNVIPRNIANMVGHGLDMSITSRNINGVFGWNTSLLFNYQTNKTTAYLTTASAGQVSNLLFGGGSILPIVGQSLYAIAAYRWGGLDANGNPQGYVNGSLSTDYIAIRNEANAKGDGSNFVVKGSAIPVTFGSLINSFSYRHFELSLNIAYKGGYYFSKPALSYSALAANGQADASYANRWQKAGDEKLTNIPSFQYPINSDRDNFYQASEINVLKGDHIRLQYVNLSYDWKTKLRLHVVASNLGILWRANKEGYDPDYASTIRPSTNISFGLTTHF